jgi:hypothetical protein
VVSVLAYDSHVSAAVQIPELDLLATFQGPEKFAAFRIWRLAGGCEDGGAKLRGVLFDGS